MADRLGTCAASYWVRTADRVQLVRNADPTCKTVTELFRHDPMQRMSSAGEVASRLDPPAHAFAVGRSCLGKRGIGQASGGRLSPVIRRLFKLLAGLSLLFLDIKGSS